MRHQRSAVGKEARWPVGGDRLKGFAAPDDTKAARSDISLHFKKLDSSLLGARIASEELSFECGCAIGGSRTLELSEFEPHCHLGGEITGVAEA